MYFMVKQVWKDIFCAAQTCLDAALPEDKQKLTQQAASAWHSSELSHQTSDAPNLIGEPGRPEKPELVVPRDLSRRSATTPLGLAALIHSLCHIEFNAINLAWDAVYRFRDMPREFYTDWIKVAVEEAYHFGLLRGYLIELNYDYGDFSAHNGLWEMAIDTAHDPLIRMALVPRVLEARGLDVTPGILQKLQGAGHHRAVDILEIIQRDEIGHVEIGTRWFRYLCGQRNLDADSTFKDLLLQYMRGKVRKPIVRDARRLAGFSNEELDYLEGLSV